MIENSAVSIELSVIFNAIFDKTVLHFSSPLKYGYMHISSEYCIITNGRVLNTNFFC